jgi:DNA repair protein RadA/Sms
MGRENTSLFGAENAMVCKTTVDGVTMFFKSDQRLTKERTQMAKVTATDLEASGWIRLANGSYLEPGTNIKDIEVPDFLRTRVLTGLEWVDRVVGGEEKPGFTPSCCTMLTAVPGGGKTTLCLQIANGLTKNGAVVLYNTGEESPEQVAMTRERLGLPSGFIIGADMLLVKLLDHADALRKANPSKPFVMMVDSIKTINDGKYSGTNSVTPLRVTAALTAYMKQNKGILIQVGHVNKAGQFEGKQEIKHMVDAHAHIKFDMDKKSATFGKRILAYQKNRFGPVNSAGEILRMTKEGLVSEGAQTDFELDE